MSVPNHIPTWVLEEILKEGAVSKQERVKEAFTTGLTATILGAVGLTIVGVILALGWRLVSWVGGF